MGCGASTDPASAISPASADPIPSEQLLVQLSHPTEHGICCSDARARCEFLSLIWGPFRSELQTLTELISQRIRLGYTVGSRFPLRGSEIAALVMRNMTLTTAWYGVGRGNFCVAYSWLITAMELCGITAFEWSKVPMQHSQDGWLCLVDGSVRSGFLQKLGARNQERVADGEISQKLGESAIDNTQLANVMRPVDATILLAGRVVRRFLLKMIQLRQRMLLKVVATHFDMEHLLQQRPERLATVLAALQPQELSQAGINPGNLSWRCLVMRGSPVVDWVSE